MEWQTETTSKSPGEVQVWVGVPWVCPIREDGLPLDSLSLAVFLSRFTRRTAAAGPSPRVKLGGLPPSPGRLAPDAAGTGGDSYSERPLLARSPSLSRVGRRRLRPVLKHGPRSLTGARVIGWQAQRRSESKCGVTPATAAAPALLFDLAS